MSSMQGFMGKKRSGGRISSEYKNNCGHPNGSQVKEAESTKGVKKILNAPVKDTPGLPNEAKIK